MNNINPTIWDLLDYIETRTGKKFIVAESLNAKHHQQFWYARFIAEYRCTKYFSNRPFPKTYNQKPVRQKQYLPATEQFLRIDAELSDHKEYPSQSTRDGFIVWAKEAGAIGTLQTPHGCHAYFFFEIPFAWTNAKSIVQNLTSTYSGEFTFCDASWCTSDWSRTNNNKNCDLDFFTTTTRNTHIPYCEPISNTTKLELNSTKPTIYKQKSAKSRKGGSRQENNEEFKRVWWDIKNGKSVESATSNLQFHSKYEILKAMNDPRYAIKGKANCGKTVGKKLDAVSEYVGNFSDTRLIQRSTTVFSQIAHSISDLRETTNEAALRLIDTLPKFAPTKTLIIAHMGQDWKPQICQLLDNNRSQYGTEIGKLWVSKVVLDIVLTYLSEVKQVTRKALNNYLRMTLPLPVSEFAQHGSSLAHTKRILNLLVKSEILLPFYAGRSTHYETVKISSFLLDALSSNNTKQSLFTRTRDLPKVQEDKVIKRHVRITGSVQVSGRSEDKTFKNKESNSKAGNNLEEYVAGERPTTKIRSNRKFKSDLYRLETSLNY